MYVYACALRIGYWIWEALYPNDLMSIVEILDNSLEVLGNTGVTVYCNPGI